MIRICLLVCAVALSACFGSGDTCVGDKCVCEANTSCSRTCEPGGEPCEVQCAPGQSCDVHCDSGELCRVEAVQSVSVRVDCANTASCHVTCPATGCTVTNCSGADCLVSCGLAMSDPATHNGTTATCP